MSMTNEPTTPPAGSSAVFEVPILSAIERRILGVLIEKQKTTPDAYPMSLNGLVTGCNQKSNREPVMNLSEVDVEDALLEAQKKHLVVKIIGGRVERWRHVLYDYWKVSKVELAVLAELMLRGPQTEGELRGRASRMEPIDDLDTLRSLLRNLAERRLAVYLTPEGRRGTMVTHGFHAPKELEHLKATHQSDASEQAAYAAPPSSDRAAPAPRGAEEQRIAAVEKRCDATETEMDSLRAQIAEIQAAMTRLANEVQSLKSALGG